MKKLILFTLTTILLLNCSNGANEPCKDENCITDEQLNFFKMHLEDDTLTKKVLFEMSSMDLSSKDITSLDTGIFNNLINLTSVDLTSNTICVDKTDVGLAEGVNLTFDRWNCVTEAQVDFFSRHITDLDTKQKLYEAPTLDLSGNSITSLEAGIFNNLTSLTELYLFNNNLASIPTDIGKLTSLTELSLSFNDLTSIPAGIFTKLTNLTLLYVNNNQIASIPAEIGNLTNLTDLSLSSNQLASIPTEIGKLTNLTELYLFNNDLTNIPAEIGNLTSLTSLDLEDNQLASIPDGIFTRLTNLTSLLLKSGSDTNTFICNETKYMDWGLNPTSLPSTLPSTFECNN